MIEKWFTLTIQKVEKTRDVYGKFVPGNLVNYKGWFLDRAEITYSSTGEAAETNGIAWLPSTADIKENDVLRFHDEYYNIMRVIRGRRAGTDNVQFKKFYLQRLYDMGVS